MISFAFHIALVFVLIYLPKVAEEEPAQLDAKPKGEKITLDIRPQSPAHVQRQRRDLVVPLAIPVESTAPPAAWAMAGQRVGSLRRGCTW